MAHSMECESMLFVKNHIPYLWDLSNSFSNSFIDFYSCEGFHQVIILYQEEWSIKLRVENGGWHESLNLLHVSKCGMLHFVTSYMKQNRSCKQTRSGIIPTRKADINTFLIALKQDFIDTQYVKLPYSMWPFSIFYILLYKQRQNVQKLNNFKGVYVTRRDALTWKIFSAYLKGLSKYRRMAFFFLNYLFFVLEILTFFYYAN